MSRPKRERLSDRALAVIGVPSNMRSSTIDDFETYGNSGLKKVKSFMRDYLSDMESAIRTNKGLFLYGSNGVGKTFLASLAVKEAYRCRYTAKRVSFADYVQHYTNVWGATGREQKEELESFLYSEFKGVEFLVLEEIGKEIDSKITAPILEDLLRYREDNSLTTVICTNLDIDSVEDRYGYSITSLIKGNMTPILIEGRDRRGRYYDKRTE